MKRLLACAALALLPGAALISGCAVDQTGFSSYKVETKSGEQWSVDDLKADYRNKTGNELPEPEDLRSCWSDKSCYYRKWQEVYSRFKEEYDHKEHINELQKAEKERQRKEAQCYKNISCRKAMVTQTLEKAYEYNKDTNDEILFRAACKSAAQAYRSNVSWTQFLNRAVWTNRNIDPYYRSYVAESARYCWETEKAGIDWRNIIGNACDSLNTKGCSVLLY
ncbi:hypothetical protein [Zymobacter palmae]|uniref:hypothetical protein n=1 Tax=Zymobacter palmae TaxID=33074 RepID=UPI000489B296|nr:hypothetical protein [Zymobacter palmae]